MSEFKVGDVVQLKTGGAAFVVTNINDDGRVVVHHWPVSLSEPFIGVYDPVCLRQVFLQWHSTTHKSYPGYDH